MSYGSDTTLGTGASARPATAASRPDSQQAWPTHFDPHRVDSHQHADTSRAAGSAGGLPTGMSNRHRSDLQECQQQPARLNASRDSGTGMRSGHARTTAAPEAKPYATEQSLKVLVPLRTYCLSPFIPFVQIAALNKSSLHADHVISCCSHTEVYA